MGEVEKELNELNPKGSDCVLETDAVVILWQALLSALESKEERK